VLCLLVLGSCGYDTGLSLGEGHQSIGIEVFGNEGPLPNLERDLHVELSRSARNLLTGELVSPALADVVLKGEISAYGRRGGILRSGNLLEESGLRLYANATLVDPRTGDTLRGPVRASVQVGYLLNADPAAEDVARQRAVKNVADELLLLLFTPHGDQGGEEMMEVQGTPYEEGF